jgi:molybdopterin molybdotransferase
MGHAAPRALAGGEALRIPTGGALPEGADAVVPIEDVEDGGERIAVRAAIAPGQFVTQPGEDMRAGETALERGRRIGGPELGVLATLGIVDVPVYRRPAIGSVSTGDELVPPATAPGPGQVRDSNRFAIAGTLRAMGARPMHYPRSPDTVDALRAILNDALAACDAVILTGGSSVGARDVTPDVVDALGAPGVVVHGLRVKPGKPTVLAAVGAKPVIGLPGNPTSALMILEAVAAPIVAALTGERRALAFVDAIAEADFAGRDGWTWFVPALLSLQGASVLARPLALRSAHVSLLARASGYAVIGESPSRIAAGAPVRIYRFSSGGAAPREG